MFSGHTGLRPPRPGGVSTNVANESVTRHLNNMLPRVIRHSYTRPQNQMKTPPWGLLIFLPRLLSRFLTYVRSITHIGERHDALDW